MDQEASGAGAHAHAGQGAHAHPGAGYGRRAAESRRTAWVLALTGAFMAVEAVGGVLSHSLALLADAGHMFTDVAALAFALFALRMARRPPSLERTYGYVRLEILAALVNGAMLLGIAGWITWEAVRRLGEPVLVDAPLMLGVAAAGLVVNAAGAVLLHAHAGESLNARGAYLHVLGDLLGSVGTLAAGGVILFTGWLPVDALVSVLIALLILVSAWRLVKEAAEVLLESAPAHIDVQQLVTALERVPGLRDVHDVHVWTVTSGFVALSGHGVVDDPMRHGEVLEAVRECLKTFGIEHVTFQLEPRTLYQIPPRARHRHAREEQGG